MTTKTKTFLTRRQLQERYGGKSHMFIEDLLKNSAFPRPIKLGDKVASHRLWDLDEIEAYEREKAIAGERARLVPLKSGESVRLGDIRSMSGGADKPNVVATLEDGRKVELAAKRIEEVLGTATRAA